MEKKLRQSKNQGDIELMDVSENIVGVAVGEKRRAWVRSEDSLIEEGRGMEKRVKVVNVGDDAVNNNQEDSFWFVRARANELRDGDKNTKYFHHKASQSKTRNRIDGLMDENGVWKNKRVDMEGLISAYFADLFGTSSPTGFQGALEGLKCVVTDEMNAILDREPTGTRQCLKMLPLIRLALRLGTQDWCRSTTYMLHVLQVLEALWALTH
uniref:Uncharacterized protein n=1 Tax=Chenopodium quinoa TaxID=63459 RepID=A0A803MD71_CHEQI